MKILPCFEDFAEGEVRRAKSVCHIHFWMQDKVWNEWAGADKRK
jgi:hypothetical protein